MLGFSPGNLDFWKIRALPSVETELSTPEGFPCSIVSATKAQELTRCAASSLMIREAGGAGALDEPLLEERPGRKR